MEGSETSGDAEVPRLSTRQPSSSSAHTMMCCVRFTSTLPGLSSSAATSAMGIETVRASFLKPCAHRA